MVNIFGEVNYVSLKVLSFPIYNVIYIYICIYFNRCNIYLLTCRIHSIKKKHMEKAFGSRMQFFLNKNKK
jgi:hypothetical protein